MFVQINDEGIDKKNEQKCPNVCQNVLSYPYPKKIVQNFSPKKVFHIVLFISLLEGLIKII